MHNKVFLTAFGLIIAGITGATSIAAATHPERVAELRQFALGIDADEQESVQTVSTSSDSKTSADLESIQPGADTQDVGGDTRTSQSVDSTIADSKSKNREREEDEDDDDRDDDSRGGSVQPTQSQTAPLPTPTPAASTVKTFTMAQVALHHSSSDCYTTINGIVYDLTPFIHSHPGGVTAISQLCGINGAALFQAQHGGQGKPEQELASLKIGVLVQ